MSHTVSSSSCDRRGWLQLSGGTLAGGLLLPRSAVASSKPAVEPLNRFPRMVHEHFVAQVRRAEERSLRLKASLKTRADAERYVETVRKKIRQSFGPFPEKTPLKPRVTGVVERDAYKIEKVIFESRPGFLVTANLYVPKGRKFPLPGVVGTCGHSHNGKAAAAYQSFAQGLARMGYVVLIYDPIGQGERLQYPTDDLKKSHVGVGVKEHLLAGNQQFLVGEFFGTWRAWDGVRALDYLLTREEVDPKHVGVTGNSGGGTMTTWLCGLEQRWTMAAPACFVTTFRRNIENELPADTEQCPPKALALGLDHDGFLAALAPKPIVILAKEGDYFDVRGSTEAYERLKRLYKLLGAEDNIRLHIGPGYHGYSQENRVAMYEWFNRATKISTFEGEPKLALEKDETLWCTPHGQVAELKSRTVFSFTKAKSLELAKARKPLAGRSLRSAVTSVLRLDGTQSHAARRAVLLKAIAQAEGDAAVVAVDSEGAIYFDGKGYSQREASTNLLDALKSSKAKSARIVVAPDAQYGHTATVLSAVSAAGIPVVKMQTLATQQPPRYHILRTRRSRGYPLPHAIHYAVETEPGIHSVVTRLSKERHYSRPPKSAAPAILYVSHHSADAELRDESLIKQTIAAAPKAAVYACDVRGVGESRPNTCGENSFLSPYGSDYFYAIHSLMLDRPYLGRKTHDVLRVLDWLAEIGHRRVHIVGTGWGALPATFAAVLSPRVAQVTLKQPLTSYGDIAQSEHYTWPLSTLLPDVLKRFDLPDCYRELKQTKKLRLIEPDR